MKRARRIFLLILASLSLSGCGGSRNLTFSSGELTFKEVEEKMEYVLMSEDVKIEFYSIDKYGKFVSYVVITREEYFLTARGDNVYGEQQE